MVNKIIKSKIFKQFTKFCTIGVIGTGIDFGILNLGVLILSWNVYAAATISFILAATNNFFLNKYWTFTDKSKGSRFIGQYAQYLAVSVGGLLLNLGIMFVLIEQLDLWYNWAKVFATGLVIMWNFSLNKYWTFRNVDVKMHKTEIPKI